jgi:hypothetical protein
MISLEPHLDDIHDNWRTLWRDTLPEPLRERVFSDARLREDLGRRIAAGLGAAPIADAPDFGYRDYLVFRADPERAARVAGLLLFAEPLSRSVERADVERLAEDFGLADATLALRLRHLRPADELDLVLPDPDTVMSEGRAALRAWIETLPSALADRATLMLPRDPDPVVYGFAAATRVAVAVIALEALGEEASP